MKSPTAIPVTLRGLTLGIAAGLGVACLCTALGSWWWVFGLLEHFRLQLCVLLVASMAAALALRMRRTAVLQAFLGVWAALPVLPYALPLGSDPPPEGGTGRPMRLLLANVHTANTRHGDVRAMVREAAPDVFVALEVNERWIEELDALRQVLPHAVLEPRPDNFGIALYSRHPFAGKRVAFLGEAGIPTLVTSLDLGGGATLTVVAAHPLPSASRHLVRMRDEVLGEVARIVQRTPGPTVLLGDLNCTPWAPPLRALREHTGLRDASTGRGIQATFPWPLLPLMIPIDHCLVSGDLHVLACGTGPPVGSDHLPVVVDVALPPR